MSPLAASPYALLATLALLSAVARALLPRRWSAPTAAPASIMAIGIFGLAAHIQVGATLPDNFIAFEYPARFEPFWYDITEGFDGMPVKDGMIDVPDRPGMGVELIPEAAKKYLSEEDADFFD